MLHLPVPYHPVTGMQIFGWMKPRELLWLGAQAEQMDSLVEIGSLRGRSSRMLLTRCPGTVYCVDPWEDQDFYHEFLANCGEFTNLRMVRDLSVAAAGHLPDVDMTFIDGDHEYDSVASDIAAWLPKTKRLICGHDYGNIVDYVDFPGVAEAVNEAFDKVFQPPGTTLWAVWL